MRPELAPLLAAAMIAGCAAEPAPQPPQAQAPAALPELPPAPPPAAPAPMPAADGLVLHGLLPGGAVIAFPDGGQRFVAIGREALPGLALAGIGQHHALLKHGGGELRLGFAGPSVEQAAATASAAGEDALAYRLALELRRADGRIQGFAIRSGAALPVLARAGLRPGDIILAVNGQAFDSEEKVIELPGEIAGSVTAEFEIERDGAKITRSLRVNPRT